MKLRNFGGSTFKSRMEMPGSKNKNLDDDIVCSMWRHIAALSEERVGSSVPN